MIDASEIEQAAVRHARKPFAETLSELGLMEPFWNRSAAEIDRLIVAAVYGYRRYMQDVAAHASNAEASLKDDIPF